MPFPQFRDPAALGVAPTALLQRAVDAPRTWLKARARAWMRSHSTR